MQVRLSGFRADWRFTAGLFFTSVLLQTAAFGQLTAFTPIYLREIIALPPDQVPFWTGTLAALSLGLAIPLAPWWGVLADRYSHKLFIVRSMAVDAIGYSIAAVATDLWHVIALRMVLGFSFGNVGIIFATQSLITPDRRVGTAIGIIQAAMPLGMSLGPLFGGFVIEHLGLRGMFAVNAIVSAVAFLLVVLFLREPDIHSAHVGVRRQLDTVARFVMETPAVRWNFVIWFLLSYGMMSVDPYVPLLIERVYAGPDLPLVIGTVLALYGITTGLATPIVARIGERVGATRWLAITTPVLAVAVLLMSVANSLPAVIGAQLLRALPQSGIQAVLYTHLVHQVPRELRASVMSLSPLPRNVAGFLAPLTAAILSSLSLGLVFVAGGIAYLGAFASTVPLRRASRPVPDSPEAGTKEEEIGC